MQKQQHRTHMHIALLVLVAVIVVACSTSLLTRTRGSALRPLCAGFAPRRWPAVFYPLNELGRKQIVNGMLQWMGLSGKADRAQTAPIEKLKGYHQLAKDALEQAYQADTAGSRDRATKLYRMAVEAINEGLQLPVQGSGLGPLADNVSSWKHDLQSWQQATVARLRFLESSSANTSIGGAIPEPIRPVQRNLALGPSVGGAGGQPQQRQNQQQNQRRRTTGSEGGVGRVANRPASGRPQAQLANGGTVPGSAGSRDKDDDKYRAMIMSEVLDRTPSVKWDDIADLAIAKQALQEAVVLPALRPDLFSGPLRAPVRGILLYGPPGNGKTMLGKALAHEAKAKFFAISASSLTSKWVGEGEKLVRALFQVAAEQSPSIIFIDEIDSILGARGGANEGDAARRLKTEFLVQFDGVASDNNDRVVVVGATNRPHEIDDAVRRRLVKRIYIPLPSEEGRAAVVQRLLKGQAHSLSARDLSKVVKATEGYSASDLTALCKEAAMGPLRVLPPSALAKVSSSSLRPIQLNDFATALGVIKPSCNREMLKTYEEFTKEFGTSA